MPRCYLDQIIPFFQIQILVLLYYHQFLDFVFLFRFFLFWRPPYEKCPPGPKLEDSIDNVMDYEYLENSVQAVLSESRAELQETIAKRILDRVLEPEAALAATVSLTKIEVMGFESDLGCTMVRVKHNG